MENDRACAEVRKRLDGLDLWLPEPRFKTLLRRERKGRTLRPRRTRSILMATRVIRMVVSAFGHTGAYWLPGIDSYKFAVPSLRECV